LLEWPTKHFSKRPSKKEKVAKIRRVTGYRFLRPTNGKTKRMLGCCSPNQKQSKSNRLWRTMKAVITILLRVLVAFQFIHAFIGVGGRIKSRIPQKKKNVQEKKKKNPNITPKRFTL